MDYDDSSTSIIANISGRKLAIIVTLILVGGFLGVQAMFGFPVRDLIRKDTSIDAKVIIKDEEGTCVVEGSDHQPRDIPRCQYNVGDQLVVSFRQGTSSIETYRLKANANETS